MNIDDGLERILEFPHRGIDIARFEPRTHELLFSGGDTHRRRLGTADSERDASTHTIGIEHQLARRRDECEIAAPDAHFLEASANSSRIAPGGKAQMR